MDIVQKRSAPSRETPTRKRGKYEIEYTMRGMHTEDYIHQKGYALRYIWRNYMRRREHTKEAIHQGKYSRGLEGIIEKAGERNS